MLHLAWTSESAGVWIGTLVVVLLSMLILYGSTVLLFKTFEVLRQFGVQLLAVIGAFWLVYQLQGIEYTRALAELRVFAATAQATATHAWAKQDSQGWWPFFMRR